MEFKTMSKPFLIQRGSFRDVKEEYIEGIDSLISFDYMGSSEFEFGALPQSLDRMLQNWDQYVVTPVFEIKDVDGQTMFILCRKNQFDEILASVKVFASEPYSRDLHTKEFVGLHDYIQGKISLYNKINFWWDVTGSTHNPFRDSSYGNDWMCCFGDDMRLLILGLHRLMIKRKMTPDSGPKIPSVGFRPIPDTSIKEDNKSIIIVKGDKTTTILKRSIMGAELYDSTVTVTVKAKGGSIKKLSISTNSPSSCHMLLNLLKRYIYAHNTF
jgi:hypothetical protein